MTIKGEEEGDTFQVEKHSHALNNMEQHYKTFVSILKDAVEKMGSYAPIEGADMDVVVKMVIDVKCMAWKKAMQGVKMGSSKMIMKNEEKKEGVIRAIEDRDVPMEPEQMVDPDAIL